MRIKPIRTKKDYRAALQEIQKLWGAAEGSDAGDRLDVLVTLVDAYEEEHERIAAPNPIAAIEHRLDQMGYTQADLSRVFGSRARASEVLNRKRKLTLEMIRILHNEFQIPLVALIQDYPLAKRATPRRSRSAA